MIVALAEPGVEARVRSEGEGDEDDVGARVGRHEVEDPGGRAVHRDAGGGERCEGVASEALRVVPAVGIGRIDGAREERLTRGGRQDGLAAARECELAVSSEGGDEARAERERARPARVGGVLFSSSVARRGVPGLARVPACVTPTVVLGRRGGRGGATRERQREDACDDAGCPELPGPHRRQRTAPARCRKPTLASSRRTFPRPPDSDLGAVRRGRAARAERSKAAVHDAMIARSSGNRSRRSSRSRWPCWGIRLRRRARERRGARVRSEVDGGAVGVRRAGGREAGGGEGPAARRGEDAQASVARRRRVEATRVGRRGQLGVRAPRPRPRPCDVGRRRRRLRSASSASRPPAPRPACCCTR